MNSCIKSNPHLNILVVESSGTLRNMMSDSLRALGFNSIHPAASGKDALNFLESTRADWIIMPLMMEQPVNALQILKEITSYPQLKHVETSLFFDPNSEAWCLPAAFSLGLLTCHPRCNVKDAFERELSNLLMVLDRTGANKQLVAASYLRPELVHLKKNASLLTLEENLLALYPGTPELLVALSEAQFLANKRQEAVVSLRQAQVLSPSMESTCDRLLAKYGAQQADAASSEGKVEVEGIGLKSAMLVDPDTNVLRVLSGFLAEIGVKNVITHEDGAAAWQQIQAEGCPQIIIQEWRIPSLTGPVLIQRVREAGHAQVPIFVASSLIQRDEMPLVREMGVDAILAKPFDREGFFDTLIWTLQQHRHPTEYKSLERKIRRCLSAGDEAEAKTWIAKMLADPHAPLGLKKHMEAEFQLSQRHNEEARNAAFAALKAGGDSLSLLNLIGKCMIRLHQFEGALSAFEKAHQLCPFNIERILDVAYCQTQLGQLEDAATSIEAAKTLDPSNENVTAAEAGNLLERGNVKRARHLLSEVESSDRIIGLMNNRAVALARTGKIEEGITLYQSTLAAVPEQWREARMAVTYNIALAYVRVEKLERALEAAEKIDTADPKVGAKAKSLVKRLQRAIQRGEILDLRAVEAVAPPPGAAPQQAPTNFFEELMKTPVGVVQGDIGLHLLFNELEESDQRVMSLLEKKPLFRPPAS